MIVHTLRLNAGLFALLCAVGFVPALHPATNTVSLFTPVLLVAVALGALTLAGWIRRLALALCLALGAWTVAWPLAPQRAGDDLRVYSKNLYYANEDMLPVLDDILKSGADIVLLQEVSTRNEQVLEDLAAAYPHQARCAVNGYRSTAIASTRPFQGPTRCALGGNITAARIKVAGQGVDVVSVHIPWPWPYESPRKAKAVDAFFAQMTGPAVLAGDFNATPWSDRVRRIARHTGTRLAGPNLRTLHHPELRLPIAIDFALSPGGGRVTRRPLFGSDHRGLIADLALFR